MADPTSSSGDAPPIPGTDHPPDPGETGHGTGSTDTAYSPAGFWVRFGAAVIDGILLFFVYGILFIPLQPLLMQAIQKSLAPPYYLSTAAVENLAATLLTLFLVWVLLGLLVTWLYFSYFESSRWLGTPGKQTYSLRVTDLCGDRISFLRACARTLAKGIALLPLGIGLFIIGFTEGKHGLHDMLVGTHVTYTSTDQKGSSWHRVLIAGSLLMVLVVAGMGVLVVTSVSSQFAFPGMMVPEPVAREPVVVATAQSEGSSVFVTWQGGADREQVKGYRVMIGDPLVTYPESGELYPAETGNITWFGSGEGGRIPVVVVATMVDGRIRIIIDTEVVTPVRVSTTSPPTEVTGGSTVSPTPASTPPPVATLLSFGQSYSMDDNSGKQIVHVSVESLKQKETLYYPSGNYSPPLYTKTAIPGHRFVLVGVEFQLVGLHGEGLRTYFMTPRAESFTLCEGGFCVNATDPDEFGTGATCYIRDEGSLYRARLIDKENHGDGLLVFEAPDHLQPANATVRFCPVNDPSSAGWPRCADSWDCDRATIGWRLR